MSPNCETASASTPSASPRFVPSLVCIAEEEPRMVAIRVISVPATSSGEGAFLVKIPVFDVNVYSPEPPRQPMPESYQRLLAEMDKYIGGHKMADKYKEMAKDLRRKVALEQAECRRMTSAKFTDRDWYWYAEQTGNYVDEPSQRIEKNEEKMEETREKETTIVEKNENVFDLNVDF